MKSLKARYGGVSPYTIKSEDLEPFGPKSSFAFPGVFAQPAKIVLKNPYALYFDRAT